ncbi:T9SS type A sorting domain-containing protein [Kordia sp.]|uniref:T9SS type A sorting domain-containing protein n=1 Tax=Kordia sp. TaxID=1965332 RepID=UPI003D6B5F78
MKKIYALILVLLVNYSLQAQDDPDLLGTWYLHYIETNGSTMYVPDNGGSTVHPSIIFSNLVADPFVSNATGDGMCNNFFSHYTLPSSGTLTTSFFSRTFVICEPGASYELIYFTILENEPTSTFSYTIDLTNNTLTMIDLLGEKLVYGRQILSVKDNEAFSSSIKIYPNPVQNELSMTGISTNSKTSYSIYNTLGNIIISERSLTQKTLDVTQLKAGVYFIKIQQQGKSAVKKFVKI